MTRLTSGDKCWVNRLGKLHYGVCVGRNPQGEAMILHNVLDVGVCVVGARAFAKGQPIHIAPRAAPERRNLIVKRALDLVDRPYKLVRFNCEHAATLAVTGQAQSLQVQRVLFALGAVSLYWLNQSGTAIDRNGYRRDRAGRFASRLLW